MARAVAITQPSGTLPGHAQGPRSAAQHAGAPCTWGLTCSELARTECSSSRRSSAPPPSSREQRSSGAGTRMPLSAGARGERRQVRAHCPWARGRRGRPVSPQPTLLLSRHVLRFNHKVVLTTQQHENIRFKS